MADADTHRRKSFGFGVLRVGLLIERHGYRILKNRIRAGSCPDCARAIPGFWEAPRGRAS